MPIPRDHEVRLLLEKYCVAGGVVVACALPGPVERTRQCYNNLVALVSERSSVERDEAAHAAAKAAETNCALPTGCTGGGDGDVQHETETKTKTEAEAAEAGADGAASPPSMVPTAARSGKVVRAVNNFLKSVLFARHILPGRRIADLGCGRGQDLLKLGRAKPALVLFVDIAERCLYEAERRWKRNRYPFAATFVQDDFSAPRFLQARTLAVYRAGADSRSGEQRTPTTAPLLTTGRAQRMVHVVSCQFSAHYAFYSRRAAQTFVDNVARMLRPGGVFVGTAPHGERVGALLADALVRGERRVDSPTFSLWLDEKHPVGRAAADAVRGCAYVPYWFHMRHTVECCRQYLMPFRELVMLCAERGMLLRYARNLRSAFDAASTRPNNAPLMRRMGIDRAHVGAHDRDHLSLYCSFVFVKVRVHAKPATPRCAPPAHPTTAQCVVPT